jgi:hypothetical protein
MQTFAYAHMIMGAVALSRAAGVHFRACELL